MTHNRIDELMPVIKRAAKSVVFQWPGVIEMDDAEQEIALHLLKRPNSITKILGMDDKARYRAVVGMGHQIASQARADYDYYKGSYYYSAKEVKAALQRGILDDEQDRFRTEKLDIEDALWKIASQYHAAIIHRYVDGEVPSAGAEKMTLSRGIGALVDAMNSVHRKRYAERDDGPGSRKAVSNGEAQIISKSNYEGEDLNWEEASRVERAMGTGFGAGGWK